MDRSVAIGATSGSLSALVLRLLTELVQSDVPAISCPICPELVSWFPEDLDLVVGLLLGPLLDIVYLLCGSWRLWIRSRLASLQHPPEQLYKLLNYEL